MIHSLSLSRRGQVSALSQQSLRKLRLMRLSVSSVMTCLISTRLSCAYPSSTQMMNTLSGCKLVWSSKTVAVAAPCGMLGLLEVSYTRLDFASASGTHSVTVESVLAQSLSGLQITMVGSHLLYLPRINVCLPR